MTDRTIYDKATPEAKRRLASKCMGWQYRESYRLDSLIPEIWKPDESLDQCRLLENKAKETPKIWSKYDEILFELGVCRLGYAKTIEGGKDLFPLGLNNLSNLTANDKLFCLFVAFGVDFQKELG